MKRLFLFIVAWFGALVICGLYGAAHDQISYSVSHEYFTLFKFEQFNLVHLPGSDRAKAAMVGVLATWWMGVPIGLIVGGYGFCHKSPRRMLFQTLKAYGVVAAVALCVGILGLGYGFFLADHDPLAYDGWFIPGQLEHLRHYLSVGHMHNFSYIGGALGIIAGAIYQRKTASGNSEQKSTSTRN